MANRILGVASIELGDIAGDGGMGTSLSAIGDTVRGTAIFENEEGQTTEFFIEESDTAIESILSEPGGFFMRWSTNNLAADVLVKLFGGTKTTGPPVKYTPPSSTVVKELSIKITDKKGNVLNVVRGRITAKYTVNFSRTSLGQLDISASVLEPTKVATAPWELVYA